MVFNAICRFLIHRYMGDFLNKAVKPEDLALSLRDGEVSLREVELNAAHINALLEPYGLVHLCEGYVGLIRIVMPKWDQLLDTSLQIIIEDLQVTLNPMKEANAKNAQDLVNSVTEILARSVSMDSATATEFFRQEEEVLDNDAVIEFASKIELLMARLKVVFKNVAIRIESEQNNVALGLEIRIHWMEFVDEYIDKQPDIVTEEPPAATGDLRKLLHMRDIRLYTDVFTPITSVSLTSMNSSGDESGNFLPPDLIGSMATSSLNYASCYTHVPETKEGRFCDKVYSTPVQFAEFSGDRHTVRIVCHNVTAPTTDENKTTPPPNVNSSASTVNKPPATALGKKIEIDLLMGGTFYFMLSASQLFLLGDLIKRLVPKAKHEADSAINERLMNTHQYEQLTNQLQNDNFYRISQLRHWSANVFKEMTSVSQSKSSSRPPLKSDLYQISLDNTSSIPGSSFPTGNFFHNNIDDSAINVIEMSTQRRTSASRVNSTQKTPDVLSICIKTPNILGVITHEDPMSQANINKALQEKGSDGIKIVIDQMAKESDDFFMKARNIKMTSDLLNAQRFRFDSVYSKNHIRMMMQLADFRFTSESGLGHNLFDITSTFKRFDFTEYLMKESINGATEGMLFDIFNCSEATTGFMFHFNTLSTVEQELKCTVEIDVQPCRSEIDPSIIDRLSNLIVTKPFFATNPIVPYDHNVYDGVVDSQKFQVRFYCPAWEVDLRIPVADFSASSLAYNVRNVRPQYLKLEMSELFLNAPNFRFEDIATFGRLDLRCSSILSTFVGDCDYLNCQSIDRRFLYAKIPSQERPFLSISYDFRNKSLVDTNRILDMNESVSGSFCKVPNNVSPFTKKSDFFDSVKLVIPGNREELKEFANTCHDHSDVNFELFLCSVNLHLPSKRFFEVLYNRFASDMALFTLKSPVFTSQGGSQGTESELRFIAMNSDEEDCELDNRDYYEDGYSKPLISTRKSHKFSFDVAVDDARVLLGTVGGEGENQFKSQIGIELDLVKFFFVFGFQGDIDLGYCFFAAERNTVLHRNLLPSVASFQSDVACDHFLVRSQSDVFAEPLTNTDLCKNRDDHNLSVAVKLQTHIDPIHSKTCKNVSLAVAARNTIVYFRPFTNPSHFWASQLSEFFNVQEEEIPSYEWPVVTINLDFHLGSVVLAYDHRNVVPMNPMQLRIAIGTCDLSGSIVQSTNAFKFRCYLQETAVFLGKENKKCVHFSDSRPKGLKSVVKILGLEVLKVNVQYSSGFHDGNGLFIPAPTIDTLLRDGDLRAWMCHDTIFEFYKLLIEFIKSEYATVFSSKKVESTPSKVDLTENPFSSQLLDTISSAMEDASLLPQPSRLSLQESDSGDEFGNQFDATSDSNRSNDDEFVLIEDILGCGITSPTSKVPQVRYLDDDYEITNGYLNVPNIQEENEVELPEGHPGPVIKHLIQNFSLHIFFYSGNDFGDSKPTKSYSKWETERESHECKRDGSIGGPFRDHTVCVEMNINKINFNWQIFGPTAQILSLKFLKVHNIEVLDHCLVSDIKKLFFRLKEERQPQRLFAPMLSLHIVENQKSEGKMRTSLLPLRINVDQDTSEFLADFFSNLTASFAEIAEPEPAKEVVPPTCEIPGVPDGHFEAGSFTTSSALQDAMNTELDADFGMGDLSSDLTRQLSMDDIPSSSAVSADLVRRPSTNNAASHAAVQETFFKEFTFSPTCKIKIDYVAKHVDIKHKSGPIVGLATGAFNCDRAEFVLHELSNESGLLGYSKCAEYAIEQWSESLKQQLPGVVASIGPLSPFAGLVAGIRDLIIIPFTEFRRDDGHVVQGLQRGASSFGLAAAVAAVDATQWVFSGFHYIAEFTYDVISPEYTDNSRTHREPTERATIPADLRQGVDMACNAFYRDMSRTANSIKNATAGNHSNNTQVKSLIRAAPLFIGAPVVSFAKFGNMVLQGVKSQLNPDGFFDDRNKYRR